jgi:hypothetical protein
MLWLEVISQGDATDCYKYPANDREREWTLVQGLCRRLIESCLIYNGFCYKGVQVGKAVHGLFRDAETSALPQNGSLLACLQLRLSRGTIIFYCRARASKESCLWINLQN